MPRSSQPVRSRMRSAMSPPGKDKARNPKHEIRKNKHEDTKVARSPKHVPCGGLALFRISCFGFRAFCARPAAGLPTRADERQERRHDRQQASPTADAGERPLPLGPLLAFLRL